MPSTQLNTCYTRNKALGEGRPPPSSSFARILWVTPKTNTGTTWNTFSEFADARLAFEGEPRWKDRWLRQRIANYDSDRRIEALGERSELSSINGGCPTKLVAFLPKYCDLHPQHSIDYIYIGSSNKELYNVVGCFMILVPLAQRSKSHWNLKHHQM